MTTRTEIENWLADFASDVTEEQLDQLVSASDAINDRWPDPDDSDLRERALSAAAQVILDHDTLEVIAERWKNLRIAETNAHAEMTGALIASARPVRSGPGSESDLVGRTNVSRLTVRKALGR